MNINDELEQAFRQGFYTAAGYMMNLKAIADHYGFTSQANMLCEESAEFTVALNKLRRGDQNAYKNVKEELADVLVIALQLRLLLGPKDIDDIMREKVFRQLNRIEGEKNAKP